MTLSEYAVPVFFFSAGYYADNNKTEHRFSNIPRRAYKIAKILILSLVFYGAFIIVPLLLKGELQQFINSVTPDVLMSFFVLGDFEILGAGHLWYLYSQLIVYLVMLVIERYKAYHVIYWFTPFFFLLRILLCSITLTYGYSWHWRCNFLGHGFQYIFLGYCLSDAKKIRTCIERINTVILFFVGLLGLLFSEIFVVCKMPFDLSEIGVILFSISLIFWTIKEHSFTYKNPFVKLGKEYSLYVYIFHIMISRVIVVVATYFGLSEEKWFVWCKPIIVVFVSICFSIILVNLANKQKIKHP